MRTSARTAGILTGLTLALGGVAFAAPAHADIPACTNMVQQTGVEVSDTVRAACTQGVHADLQGCASALTGAACRAAPRTVPAGWRPTRRRDRIPVGVRQRGRRRGSGSRPSGQDSDRN